jgi:hypothetical protein
MEAASGGAWFRAGGLELHFCDVLTLWRVGGVPLLCVRPATYAHASRRPSGKDDLDVRRGADRTDGVTTRVVQRL